MSQLQNYTVGVDVAIIMVAFVIEMIVICILEVMEW